MNPNLSNQKFEKLIGQRLRFRGIYDGFKENPKTYAGKGKKVLQVQCHYDSGSGITIW